VPGMCLIDRRSRMISGNSDDIRMKIQYSGQSPVNFFNAGSFAVEFAVFSR
jgi:hypothetical protein